MSIFKQKRVVKWVILVLLWFTFSPLFYYLAWRWKMLNTVMRIVLLLFSPLFLCVVLILLLILFLNHMQKQYEYNRIYRFRDKERIERITKAKFPDFKVLEYRQGRRNFLGDYWDVLHLQFLEEPDFRQLDSLVSIKEWRFERNHYSFGRRWGNGFPAPDGESEDEDRFFSISIEKGSSEAQIMYGVW